MKLIKIFFPIFILLFVFFALSKPAHAVYCDPPLSGNWTINSPCVLYEDVNGVANGDITVAPGTTVTIHSGKTLVWYPGQQIIIPDGANVIVQANAAITQDYLCIRESANNTGYAAAKSSTDPRTGNPIYQGLDSSFAANPADPTLAGLIAWWKLDEGTGATTINAISNPNYPNAISSTGSFTFPTGSTILGSATTYDNQDITVPSGATVTMWGSHTFASVTVPSGGVIDVGQYAESGDNTKGNLNISANTISVTGTGKINAAGRGYGGGGGGGGARYGDSNYCTTPTGGAGGISGSAALDGVIGHNENNVSTNPKDLPGCKHDGGPGGGFGAFAGQTGGLGGPGGNGGNGGGSFGGTGGIGTAAAGNPPAAGGNGTNGGYLAAGSNGDSTTGISIVMGSGGGGGGASSSNNGYCAGGGAGGAGGIAGAANPGSCTGGAGGSGGGAGGGAVTLQAGTSITVSGQIIADGAGNATLGGGYGAGGGIAISSPVVNLTSATIRSLGGNMSSTGVTTNGGTIKVQYATTYTGSTLTTANFPSGRVYSNVAGVNGSFSGNITTATWQTADQCKIGKCLRFAGGNLEALDVTNQIFKLSSSNVFSVSAWFKKSVDKDINTIFAQQASSGKFSYMLTGGADGKIYASVCKAYTGCNSAISTGTIPLNTWTNAAMAFDGSNIYLYINGKLENFSPYTYSTLAAADAGAYIGNDSAIPSGARTFNGYIDDVRVYTSVLTHSQVSEIAGGDNTIGKYCSTGYIRRENLLSKDYVDMGTQGTQPFLTSVYRQLLNLGMSISGINSGVKELTATNNLITTTGDNLQVCISATNCTLTPPADYGNVIIENKLGIGTGSPSNPLDVIGTGKFSSNLSVQNNYLGLLGDGSLSLGGRKFTQSPLTLVPTTIGNNWTQANSTSRNYQSCTMSADGKYQIAAVNLATNGQGIYRSTDFGVTWSQIDNNSRQYKSVATSVDGKYMTAVASAGTIYRSDDYGVTWNGISDTTIRNYRSVAMSSDGKYQTTVISNGSGAETGIFRSTDYGITWRQVNSTNNYYNSVAMSSDGKYQTAVVFGGSIYRSVDYGVSWAGISDSTNRTYYSVAMSSDGKYQTASTAVNGGTSYIYRSTDYGVTWTQLNGMTAYIMSSVAMSASGQYQIVAGYVGTTYISSDYGASWTNTGFGGQINCLAISADGKYQLAAAFSAYNGVQGIYTSTASSYLPGGGLVIGSTDPATGGVITYSGGYTIHTFTGSGTFTALQTISNAEVFVVAGGGSANGNGAGGGGGGGVLLTSNYTIPAGTVSVTVGAGGYPGRYTNPSIPGGNSSFGSIVALGGDGADGGTSSGGGQNCTRTGGSGSGCNSGLITGAAGSHGTPGQGYDGGTASPLPWSCNSAGGGGGGATHAGYAAAENHGGNGGQGYTYLGGIYGSGGGGGMTCTGGTAGVGGTNAGSAVVNGSGTSAAANFGGGGGGGSNGGSYIGGNGGSGIVIVRYPTFFIAPPSVATLDVYGSMKVTGSLLGAAGGWTDVTFGTGWSNYGNGFSNVKYKKFGDLVFIKGMATSGANLWATYPTILTLPVGFRPSSQLLFATEAGSTARFDITAAGAIVYSNGGTGSQWFSLDGIIFSTD